MSNQVWRSWGFELAALILFLSTAAIVAVVQGPDDTWDFRAYHLYNGWAFWNTRWLIDIAPAGAHTFINPLLDAVAFKLLSASTLWGTAIMGAWFGFGLYFVFKSTQLLLIEMRGVRHATLFSVSIALFSGFGAITIALTGNTMNETQLATFMAAAMYFGILAAYRRMPWLWAVCAGLLGAALGLKPTMLPYAAGPLTLLFIWHVWERRVVSAVGLVGGGIAGVLLTNGWWGYLLWSEFGSPIFPLYNDIIQSPFAPPVRLNIGSGGLSFTKVLLSPFQWATGNAIGSETPFRDARVCCGLLTSIALLAWGVHSHSGRAPHDRILVTLAACYLLGFVTWAMVFGVARYAVGFEVVGSMLVGVALVRFCAARFSTLTTAVFLAVPALVIVPLTDPGNWGRARFANEIVAVAWNLVEQPASEPPTKKIPTGAIVLLIDRPDNSNQLTHLIPLIGPDAIYVQPAGQLIMPEDGSRLSARIKLLLASDRPVVVLSYRDRNRDFAERTVSAMKLCLRGPQFAFWTTLSGEIIRLAPAQRC